VFGVRDVARATYNIRTKHSIAVNHSLTLLKMGKRLPKTRGADSKINKIVILLHLVGHLYYSPTLMMHGQTQIKKKHLTSLPVLNNG